MINLKLKPDLVQSLDRLNFYSFSHLSNGPNVHFISNLDPLSLNKKILKLNPTNTLIICVSKSFSTYETQENLKKIRAWFLNTKFRI